MNLKGHLVSGVAVGVGVAVGATHYGYIGADDFNTQVAVAGTALFFSLFPDLDTSSVPQRWFFRLVFGGLLYLGWTERYELATLVGILSLLPLLDHHRGWTHWKISPLAVSLLLGATYEYWRARHAFMGEFGWGNVRVLIEGHWIFLFACIAGWYTHLLLDGRFKFFPTDQDHH
jgi:hypothetical protein